MSLFISSFLPNGNYLIAADTRVSKELEDGSHIVDYDGFQKIHMIDNKTFIFMSGYSIPAKYVVQDYKKYFSKCQAKEQLIQISRCWMSRVNPSELTKALQNNGEAMVFHLLQFEKDFIKGGLYMSSIDFMPLEVEITPHDESVIVLGSYLPGTNVSIRTEIKNAKSYSQVIQAYRDVFAKQCRPEVGGDLQMYEVSLSDGLVNKMSFKIEGVKNEN